MAGVLIGATPLLTLTLAAVALPTERVSRRKLTGLLVGFVGVILVIGPWRDAGGSIGARIACLAAAFSYAAGFVYVRRFLSPRGLAPLALAASQLGAAAVLQALVTPFLTWHTPDLSLRVGASITVLGLLGTGLAYVLYFRLIGEVGATTASAVNYVVPVFAVLVSVVLLGEPVTWNLAAGGLVVLARARLRREPAGPAATAGAAARQDGPMPRRILSRDHPEWSTEVAGVLIDMDGTLVDSTAAITRQWWTFLDWYGLPPTAFPRPLHGKRAEDHVRALVPAELVDEALHRFLEQELVDVEGITAVPGATELVEQLAAAALPWGLVTSGTLPVVKRRLAAAGIAAPLVLVTAEDVVNGKPDPEAYLTGRRRLGVTGPVLALEDAPAGIDSAAGAGCHVVAVSTTHRPDELSSADLVLPDLTSLRILA